MTAPEPRHEAPGEPKVLQAAAVLAVAAAATAFVAGLGAYLYVRFTQHRTEPPGGGSLKE